MFCDGPHIIGIWISNAATAAKRKLVMATPFENGGPLNNKVGQTPSNLKRLERKRHRLHLHLTEFSFDLPSACRTQSIPPNTTLP